MAVVQCLLPGLPVALHLGQGALHNCIVRGIEKGKQAREAICVPQIGHTPIICHPEQQRCEAGQPLVLILNEEVPRQVCGDQPQVSSLGSEMHPAQRMATLQQVSGLSHRLQALSRSLVQIVLAQGC